MKHRFKKNQSQLKAKDSRENESIESLRNKMNSVKDNPEEGLYAAIETLRRFGHKRGWG